MRHASLKNLQLVACLRHFLFLFAIEINDVAELLIGDANDADRAFVGHVFSDALFVHIGVFEAGAMAHINRVLVHREAIGK